MTQKKNNSRNVLNVKDIKTIIENNDNKNNNL